MPAHGTTSNDKLAWWEWHLAAIDRVSAALQGRTWKVLPRAYSPEQAF
jgi:hypothetical protein